jgi:hypothetical protein
VHLVSSLPKRSLLMTRTYCCILFAGLLAITNPAANAAILYSGGSYVQNFDTLPNSPHNGNLGVTSAGRGWIDDTASPAEGQFSIAGVYIYHPVVTGPPNSLDEGGVSGNQRLRASGLPTTAASGSFYAYGNGIGTTERALGVVPSDTLTPSNGEVYMGLRFTNSTSQTLEQFSFSYTGEQWRVAATAAGGPAGNQSLTVDYRLGGTDLHSGTFVEIPLATFDSPIDTPDGTNHLDGNAPENRVTGLGATVTGLNWAPGTDLWLRWTAINKAPETGTGQIADHGLAIDDLRFSATVPEPSSLLTMILGCLALLSRRSSRLE